MNNTSFSPVKSLSPDQRTLLRTALSSNSQTSPKTMVSNGMNGYNQNGLPNGSDASPQLLDGGIDDQPLFDPLDDGQFDWDGGEQLFDDAPDFAEDGDLHDKRKIANGSDDGEASKRQEGDTKTPKKPGRKPLTEQPATKRKAQNRAAQRAFRERKEQHLKTLETKVEGLEKESEATNHENRSLRAQVEKLTTEVKEYRQRLSLNSTGQSSPPLASQKRGSSGTKNSNDFSFAFPGMSNNFINNSSMAPINSYSLANSISTPGPHLQNTSSNGSIGSASAISGINGLGGGFNPPQTMSPSNLQNDAQLQELTGLFSPSVLETASRTNSTSDYGFPSGMSSTSSVRNGGFNPKSPQKFHRGSSASTANSPASTMRFDSSVGTTPEPLIDSPIDSNNMNKSDPILNTISEETPEAQRKVSAAMTSPSDPTALNLPGPSPAATSNNNMNNFDWFVQENNGAFDPVLFGDYRDPQDSILNSLSDDFFSDALPAQDFTSPYNTGYQMPSEPKVDLMKEIEAKQEEDVVPPESKYIECPELWRRVQQSSTFQSAHMNPAELDDLCTQLTSKAKCNGKGAVIDEKDVNRILGPKPSGAAEGKGMFGNFVTGLEP